MKKTYHQKKAKQIKKINKILNDLPPSILKKIRKSLTQKLKNISKIL